MIKAKRLFASVLCVIMLMSAFATIALADTQKYFATDYVCVPNDPSTPAIKNTAVMFSYAAHGLPDKTEIPIMWDGEEYIFVVGENVFADYSDAHTAADRLAGSGIPQVLIAAGTYNKIDFGAAVQAYGYDWNQNPNVKDEADPFREWTYNPAFTDGTNTEVLDVFIAKSASGASISLYGLEITHRFYDIMRGVNNNKTVITLKNCVLNQKAEYKTLPVYHNSGVTGRTDVRANQFAFSFWNGNSHHSSSGTANVNNKDETHLINFRIQRVDMKQPASVTYTNYFMDELASPTLVFDGLCADWQNSGLKSMGWFKVADKVKKSYLCIKNSYIGMDLSIETRTGGSSPDTDPSLSTTVEFSGNIIKNKATIYQNRTSKVDFNNNIFISPGAKLFKLGNDASASDLTNKVSIRDNIILGTDEFIYDEGSANSKVDMTGTFILPSVDANYKSQFSSIAPTGNIKYDYFYMDGARTIKSSVVQEFSVDGVVKDDNALTMTATVPSDSYKFSPVVTANNFSYKIFNSDAEFSNIGNLTDAEKVTGALTLKNTKNYFVFVAYSPDGQVAVPYKFTITREGPAFPFALNGQACQSREVYFTTDSDEFVLEPAQSAAYSTKLLDASLNELNSSTVTFDYRGQTKEFVYELSDGVTKEYYTVYVTRAFSKECEILSVSGLVKTDSCYEITVPKGTKSFTFDIEISPDATATVFRGTEAYAMIDNKITVNNVKEGAYTLAVVAQDGVTSTAVSLVVNISKSNKADLLSVKGATANADGSLQVVTKGLFTIEPTVSEGATYTVYLDKNLTSIEPTGVIDVYGNRSAYIVVTSEDGSNSSLTEIKFVYDDSGITIGGVQNTSNYVYVETAKNQDTYTLDIKAKNCTYKLYADAKKTVSASNTIKLETGNTIVYAEVTYQNGTSDFVQICISSQKSEVNYNDQSLIPQWAQSYVYALNKSGIGLFKGDEKGNFNADSGMTRYEVAAIAVRLMGVDASQFADVEHGFTDSIEPWALNYVKAASALGVLSGTYDANGKLIFDGSSTTTREQLAKIMVDILLYREGETATAQQVYNKNKADADAYFNKLAIVDSADIADWAIPYVKLSLLTGVFEGSLENNKLYFKPKQNIKRQEMAVVACKYYFE